MIDLDNATNLQDETPDEAHVLLLDVPLNSTVDEATRLMNEPYERGYIHRALEWPDGVRVVYVQRAKPAAKAEAAPSREARAIQFIRENREMSAKELAAGLKALQYPRSVPWVSKKRAEIVTAER